MGALSRLLVIALTPAVVAGALLWLPRALRALVHTARRPGGLAPAGPPLEQTAADLRRLLAEHRAVRASPRMPVRASRLRALEAAITDCALDAARALDVPAPNRAGREPLDEQELRGLLRALVASGVVLPRVETFGH